MVWTADRLQAEFQTQMEREARGEAADKFLLVHPQFAQFAGGKEHGVAKITGLGYRFGLDNLGLLEERGRVFLFLPGNAGKQILDIRSGFSAEASGLSLPGFIQC